MALWIQNLQNFQLESTCLRITVKTICKICSNVVHASEQGESFVKDTLKELPDSFFHQIYFIELNKQILSNQTYLPCSSECCIKNFNR